MYVEGPITHMRDTGRALVVVFFFLFPEDIRGGN